MRLYDELAPWFYLLTAPEEYAEEAAVFSDLLVARARRPVEQVLELGSGGGNNASHMKRRFRMTLSDLSPAMLELSRGLNPECEHVQGDMRDLRLGRRFDAVFVHDAVMYMAGAADLRAAMATAAEHCRPGGVVLLAPDCVRDTYHPHVREGGLDGEDGRSLRYREVAGEPEPGGSTYRVELVLTLRQSDGGERREREIHRFGLFARCEWIEWLSAAGFEVETVPSELGEPGTPTSCLFVGVRDGSGG